MEFNRIVLTTDTKYECIKAEDRMTSSELTVGCPLKTFFLRELKSNNQLVGNDKSLLSVEKIKYNPGTHLSI